MPMPFSLMLLISLNFLFRKSNIVPVAFPNFHYYRGEIKIKRKLVSFLIPTMILRNKLTTTDTHTQIVDSKLL